ncbi:MAG TPA: efflux RND transporter periplasmic adaptor subunit, partial [Nitrospiraceae bacterium]|nr:efflux RND transporter periplasmic adaptor subunit [Nitrospiraceae bacterium]
MLNGKQRRWVLIGLGILLLFGGVIWLTEPRQTQDAPRKEPATAGGQAQQGKPSPAPADTRSDAGSTQAYAMVSPYKQQLIGVTTAVVEKRPLETTVRAVGRVEYDEQRIAYVNLRISGWVEDLFVDYTGQLVRKGQPLFTLYSPDLVASQDEFLLAIRAREKLQESPLGQVRRQTDQLIDAARERLRLWTLTDRQIDDIARRGKAQTYLTIFSPVTGYVIDKQVFKGMFVQPQTRLYSIADLSVVWMTAEIYEFEVPFVTINQRATATFTAYPTQPFHGRVSYLYPYLNQQARTVKVRVDLPNPKLLLKPEMYGTVQIKVDRGHRLALPEGALLDSGTRQLVFLVRGEGFFEPREVKVGPKIGSYYEVHEGLQPGDRVVTSGNFLIDSESKLMAATNMMGSLGMGGVKMEQARMGEMEMGGMPMGRAPSEAGKQTKASGEKTVGGLTIALATEP